MTLPKDGTCHLITAVRTVCASVTPPVHGDTAALPAGVLRGGAPGEGHHGGVGGVGGALGGVLVEGPHVGAQEEGGPAGGDGGQEGGGGVVVWRWSSHADDALLGSSMLLRKMKLNVLWAIRGKVIKTL